MSSYQSTKQFLFRFVQIESVHCWVLLGDEKSYEFYEFSLFFTIFYVFCHLEHIQHIHLFVVALDESFAFFAAL
jgi:hypothetical protein